MFTQQGVCISLVYLTGSVLWPSLHDMEFASVKGGYFCQVYVTESFFQSSLLYRELVCFDQIASGSLLRSKLLQGVCFKRVCLMQSRLLNKETASDTFT